MNFSEYARGRDFMHSFCCYMSWLPHSLPMLLLLLLLKISKYLLETDFMLSTLIDLSECEKD